MSTRLTRALLAAAAASLSADLRAEMVVRFTFDDSSAANIGTLGGNATVEGTSVITAGDGVGFGGTDGIRGNSAGNLVFTSTNFLNLGNLTLSTRIKRGDTATWQDFWGLGIDRSLEGNYLRLEDNGSGYALYEDGANPTPGVASGGSWEDNTWHNIVVTTSGGTGGTISLYIDGVLRSSSSNGYSQNLSVLTLLSNSWTGNRRQNANAYLDDVLAYNYGMGVTHVGHLNSITSSDLGAAGASDWVHHAGTVTLAASKTVAGLYASADTILNSGVTLTVSSGNVRIAGRNQWVQGGGSITSGTSTLTVFQDDTALTDAAFNGASISDNAGGAVSLVKSENGLLRLRSRQTYTGSTTVNGGTLSLEHGAAGLGTSASRSYVINSGAILDATVGNALADDAATANAVTVNAGGTFRLSGGSNTVGSVTLGASGAAGTAAISLTSSDASGALVLAGTTPTFTVRSAASGSTLSGAGFLSAKNANLTLEVEDGSAATDFTASSALRSAAGSSSALVKTGAGRARLSATGNNFSGGIRVDAGVLELASGATSTSNLTVNGGTLIVNGTASTGTTTVSSGTLMGSGTLGALTVASGAVLAPGNSPGKLTVGNVTYDAGSILELEASDFTSTVAAATTANDYIVSTGAVSFGAGDSPISVRLFSWNQGLSARGDATVFAESFAYSYDFLTAAGGITYNGSSTFNASLFDLDLSGFTNYHSGTWSLQGDSSKLSLVYAPAVVIVTVNVGAGQTVAASSTDLATIAVDNAFTKTGNGTLTVADALDYSNGSSINAGAVRLGASGALGSGAIILAEGASLELEAGASLANAVSGLGSVVKVGAGTTTLADLSAATNAVSVTGGTLALTGSPTVGSLSAPTNGILDLSGATTTTIAGSLAVSGGAATLGGSVTVASVALSAGSLAVVSGATLASNGALAISGGAATVGGTASATSVTVSGGSLTLASTGSLTTAGALSVTGGSASVAAGSTLSAGSISVTGGTLTGNFATRNSAISTGSSGTVVLNDAGTLSTTATFSGSGTVEYSGGGTLTLGGTSTLSGTLKVSSGTLKGSVAGSFGAGTVQVASGGALDLSGISRSSNLFNLTLAGTGVSGSGAVFNSGSVVWGNSGIRNVSLTANATLVVGGTGEGSRFDFRSDGTLNLGGNTLTKSGTGLFVLRSTPGTAGTIDVAAGNLGVEDSFTGAGTSAVAFTVRDGAGLGAYNGRTIDSAVTLQGTGAVLYSQGSTRSAWSNVILSGGGRYDNSARIYGASDGLRITGMSGTGNFLVSGGSQALYASGTWNFADGQVSTLQLNSGYLEVSGAALTTNAVLQIGSGAVSGRAVDIWAGKLTVRGLTGTGIIVANGAGEQFSGPAIAIATPDGESYAYSGALVNSTWSSSAVMAIAKSGAGTQTLSGNNTYTGGTTISAGTLAAGSSSAFGTGTVTLSGGTLDAGSQSIANAISTTGGSITGSSGTLSGAISGAGALTKSGNGTLTLSGNNSFSGGLTVSGGTLVAGSANALGAGTVNVNAGGTLLAGGLSAFGSGSITVNGGTLDLGGYALGANVSFLSGSITNAGSYTGALTMGGGTLTFADLTTFGSAAITVGEGATLDLNFLNPTNAITLSGGTLLNFGSWNRPVTVTGNVSAETLNNLPGAVTIGAGTTANLSGVTKDIVFTGGTLQNLSGYTGTLTVSSGTLDLSSESPAGDLVLQSGGTINLGGRAVTNDIVFSGGSLNGASNYTGVVTVQGTGIALAQGALGNASSVVVGTGTSVSIGSGFTNDIRLDGGSFVGDSLNNLNGTVTVADGTTLDLDGTGNNLSISNTSATIALEDGAILKGNGTVGAITVAAGGTLAPGNSPGIFNTDTMTLTGGAFDFEVASVIGDLGEAVAGTDYDTVAVSGLLDLTGISTASPFVINLISIDGLPPVGWNSTTTFALTLFTYGTIDLGGHSISQLFQINSAQFYGDAGVVSSANFTVVDDSTNNRVLVQYAPVPEPSTYGLMLGGLAIAFAAIRRRRNRV
ncbi:MAG: autotransporter-associated beta strand repeat-containing protein [Opitutales bacterium]